tara:strand:+ start:390 stop:1139 length:750 start_codon:yes stop_codon:yes gene_type:complete
MKVKYFDLKDKKVIISGGASGIGSSIVEKFCEQDSEVFFLDIDTNKAEELIETIKEKKLRIPKFYECDVLDINKLQSIITKIGNVNILINNAGNDDRHTIDDIDEEYLNNRLNLNLKHYFFATQTAKKFMIKNKLGSVINISSVSWIRAANSFSIYASAKSAIIGLTRSLAKELGQYNIRVNAIMPGSIATERQSKLWLKSKLKKEVMNLQCIKRQLMPEDVSYLALYLGSDVSSGCTKQNFIVDAGLT